MVKEEKIFWTTREQKQIPIKELSDKHLLNIFNYMFTDPNKVKQYKRLYQSMVMRWSDDFIGDFTIESSTLFDIVHSYYKRFMNKGIVFNAIILEIAIRKLDTKINFNDIYNSD